MTETGNKKQFLSKTEAASYLGVTVRTLCRWEKKKGFEVFIDRHPLNNRPRYFKDDLEWFKINK